jgi:hypothetical protein
MCPACMAATLIATRPASPEASRADQRMTSPGALSHLLTQLATILRLRAA